MSWIYYSYYDLVRKDAFDCLESVAVFARSGYWNVTINGSTASPSYVIGYYFLPLARVYTGTLIRGDRLRASTGGGSHLPEFYPLTTLPGPSNNVPGRFGVRASSTATTNVVSNGLLTIGDRTYSRFTFNQNTFEATLDLTFTASDFASLLNSVFNTWFPNQSVNLSDLDATTTIGQVLTMQGDPSQSFQTIQYPQGTITGDPITAPLYLINFNAT